MSSDSFFISNTYNSTTLLNKTVINFKMTIETLNNTLSAIDEINRQDPNLILSNGSSQAKELVYGMPYKDWKEKFQKEQSGDRIEKLSSKFHNH